MSLLLSITPHRLFITTPIEGDNSTRASEKQTEMEVQREQREVKKQESSKTDSKQRGIQESLGEEVEGELADEKTGRMPSLSPPSSVYGCVRAHGGRIEGVAALPPGAHGCLLHQEIYPSHSSNS